MSRFFQASDSSSDSSSEEEELYSDEEEEVKKSVASDDAESEDEDEDDDDSDTDSSDEGGKTGVNRFLKSDTEDESSSDEEESVTVVKSAKDKKFEELEGIVRSIENAEKIGDWAVINTEYDNLNRQLPKVLRDNDNKVPKLYIKAVSDLEQLAKTASDKQKVTPKKMNALSTRGLNAVRQKLRKNNRDYQDDIEAYREDKEGFMIEDEDEQLVSQQAKAQASSTLFTGDISVKDPDEHGWEGVGAGGRTLRYTTESILKHLRTIVEARGRKNTDRMEQIKVMETLLGVAATEYQRIRILTTLIATRFDLTSGTGNYMSQEQWKLADQGLTTLFQILGANPNIIVVEGAEEWEDDDKQPTIDPGVTFKIPGSIVSFVERLDDELTRSLQQTDPHTAEYIERLTDEQLLYTNIVRGMLYAERILAESGESGQNNINRAVMRRLEHLYFKPSAVVETLEQKTWEIVPVSIDSTITPRKGEKDTASLVQTLSNYLFQHSESIIRARAMLCQIYFLALHEEYYPARDMMLMSHLQETIGGFDISTQILYNRTLVQVGLCAFRAGLVYEAQNSLQEICGSGRQKELLAQGVQMTRYSQVSPEQERLERQRQLPFHMHINLELLECVYLTCSMLLEIPLLAQIGSSPELKKRIISKTYRRMLEYHERQIFTGPPENTRDHIMQASKALAAGEWRKAADLVSAIKIWDLMKEPARIKSMLEQQIQEEGLRTYLFTYAPYYDTLAFSTLADMFSLDERKIGAIVSRMISHEELAAALDQVGKVIVFRKGVELSRLQSLALTLSDKAAGLMEANEKALEQRTQGTANAFERDRGSAGRGRGGQRGRGGRGGSQGMRRGNSQGFTGALGSSIKV